MHWFWRAMIAVTASFVSLCALKLVAHLLNSKIAITTNTVEAIGISVYILYSIIGISIYGILTHYLHPQRNFLDRETPCRMCGYILRGITVPRCPECGENIGDDRGDGARE
ncbi:MAG: hypothetical protein ACYTF1_05510 [Planctomycetota bacterium]